MSALRKFKDFRRFLRNLDSMSDGQATVTAWENDRLEYVDVRIIPNDGMYKDTELIFRIKLPEGFPEDRPYVVCLTPVYHPNIEVSPDEIVNNLNDEYSENVCLSLFDEWSSTFGLADCIQGLLFLIYNPNTEDPLSGLIPSTISEEDFKKNVTAAVSGEGVDDNYFDLDKMEDVEQEVLDLVKNAKNVEVDDVIAKSGDKIVNLEIEINQAIVKMLEAFINPKTPLLTLTYEGGDEDECEDECEVQQTEEEENDWEEVPVQNVQEVSHLNVTENDINVSAAGAINNNDEEFPDLLPRPILSRQSSKVSNPHQLQKQVSSTTVWRHPSVEYIYGNCALTVLRLCWDFAKSIISKRKN